MRPGFIWRVVLPIALGVAVALWLLRGDMGAADVVSIRVQPMIMLSRGDIRVEVRIPRSADNRLLSVTWTAEHGGAGSTLRQLDGEDAPVLHEITLVSQPADNYLFQATVFGAAGKQRGRSEASVVGPEGGREKGGR